MTQDFNISSVAVIGGGPAGLASVFELLHTSKGGRSTISDQSLPETPAFDKIVAFEQQSEIGGIWNTKIDDPDLGLPPKENLVNNNYNDASAIHPRKDGAIPAKKLLEKSSVSEPVVTEAYGDKLQWSKSAVYDGLFSNVPKRFLRFSNIPYQEAAAAARKAPKNGAAYDLLKPLIPYKEIQDNLLTFADKYDLRQHVRLSTEVESLRKDRAAGKWVLTLRHYNAAIGKDEWYQEAFDAVVVASGHYSVPFVPKIPGLAEYELQHPGSIIHNKAWRSPKPYAGKNVLFVGGSLSSLDILQYIYPIANKTYISRRKREQIFPWLQAAAESEGIVNKPSIARFLPETREIEFTDGSKVGDIDNVILATGYHWHYSFIPNIDDRSNNDTPDKYVTVSVSDGTQGVPTSSSRLKGLYQHLFAINDPTLAFVGVKLTTLKWPTIEAGAAAVAGVWSNAKKLPPKEEQIAWEQALANQFGNHMAFHYSPWNLVKQDFIDEVIKLAPAGRANPLEEDVKYINEVEESMGVLEQLFFKFKNSELTYEETVF